MLQPELGQPTGEGPCQSPLEPSRQNAGQSTVTTGHTHTSGFSMEEPAMVPNSTGHAGGLANSSPHKDDLSIPIHAVGVPAVLPN